MGLDNLLGNFKSKVNKVSANPVDVLKDGASLALPDQAIEKFKMSKSYGEVTTLLATQQAVVESDGDQMVADTFGVECVDGEQVMTFSETMTKLPIHFRSYDELATALIGNVLNSEDLKSLNASFFGSVVENASPQGFTRVKCGSHEFFVQDKSDRLVYVFEFLSRIKESLLTERRYEGPLVTEEIINGGKAYSLVLTPKECLDIKRSYPSYVVSIVDNADISKLRLIIVAK